MGFALVAAVRLYRLSAGRVPRSRRCLYRVTCSQHTEAVARANGLVAGVRAMRARLRCCRPGYHFLFGDGPVAIECVDGTVVGEAHLSPAVLAEAAAVQLAIHATNADGG